ncbi:MAG: oligosaccharyl transferase, archaeosortase A system-associated [Euryarchaeota archaeon]|nr:oligosaccharyl transferase, archaeosortase A system-associated [Euryarchaeota archaeon]
MNLENILKYKTYLIVSLLVVFSLFTLWLRLLPEPGLVTANYVDLLGNDPWYILRQVESTVANFPGYSWFDPMTEYPTGNIIHWGSLFPQIIAFAAILLGASTRPEIMYVASWIPPLMAVAMVPLIYFIGSKIADWKTGLIAAGLITVVSGQYFYRSLFGFVDHHIAETLFSTLFCLAYITALVYIRTHPVDLKNTETLKIPLLLSVGAGISYLLGLFIMPTMILFALIVAVYTPLQYIWDNYKGRAGEKLLFINTVVFLCASIGIILYGFNSYGTGLARYSIGHVYVYITIIIGTALLYVVSKYLTGKPRYYYSLSLAGIAILGSVILMVVSSDLFNLLIGNFYSFFGQPTVSYTVQEAQPWDLASAWSTFHYGFLLMLCGFGALVYKFHKEHRAEYLFVIVWSFVMLLSTWQHIRYEYYLGANICLLSAFFIGCAIDFGWKEISALFLTGKPEKTETSLKAEPKKKEKISGKTKSKSKSGDVGKTAVKTHGPNYIKMFPAVAGIVFALLFVWTSAGTDLYLGEQMGYGGMTPDWRESLEWMGNNTPETGVDYYGVYDFNERETYEYPPESYGVMTWWDYGHWITFISKRIPNANPFQHGVSGPNGAAAFFIQQNEADSSEILDNLGTKYVITDIEMDDGKFWAMTTWYNDTIQSSPYTKVLLHKDSGNTYKPVRLKQNNYYQTMISRLHNFDGSMTEPGKVFLVEYMDSDAAESSYPVITKAMEMDAAEAQAGADEYNKKSQPGKHAAVLSSSLLAPVAKVPALQNYRLIHESPTNVISTPGYDLKYVKVFEYLPGAEIKGDGTIEVRIETNTGRKFVYRQESVDGVFTVPYSTTGNPYGVRTEGDYRIVETGQTFSVSEDSVKNGVKIN